MAESVKKAETKATAKSTAAQRPSKPKPSGYSRSAGERLHGKKYNAAHAKVTRDARYSAAEAVALAKETSPASFDATVEVHLKLGVDPRNAEENIRGTVKLPAGTGKQVRVLAFVASSQAAAAKKAGADFVSDAATLKKLESGWTDFDVAVATPDQMPEVAKLGKVLGPKGLMPNPKAGTVSADLAPAISAVKQGTIEFRVAKDATVHAGIGKVSFSADDLLANLTAYYQAIVAAKPSDFKGTYVTSLSIATTMGPGIKVDLTSFDRSKR